MATCQAITSAGRPCPCKARDGFNTCGRHKNVIIVDPTVCGQEKTNGSRCEKKCVEGDTMCKLHRTVADRREQVRRARILWGDAMDFMWGPQRIERFNQVTVMIDDAFDRGWITQEYYDDMIHQLHDEWIFYRNQRIDTTANATTELQRLALDSQNVHTKEVVAQTSDAMKFLLDTSVPADQETLEEIESAWADKMSTQRKKVLRDMKIWYDMATCVKMNDYLYKHMLDGLWVHVKGNKELIQRLWEEAFESVNKCCQGHLSRLANVLVGFTDEVKAEVPVGEILQQKIAAIAAKDIETEYKVCEAWSVFEELKIPMEERDAWIEAF